MITAAVVAVVLALAVAFALPFGVGFWFAALHYRADHEARITITVDGELVLTAPLSELARAAARHYEHDFVLVSRARPGRRPHFILTLTKADSR